MTAQLVGTWGARSADELLETLRGPGAEASDVIELRLDLPRDGAARLKELVAASPRPVIATCRRASEGGGFTAGERDRIDVLLRAADAGAAWLDVEDDATDREVERLRGSGARLIRSRHVDDLGGLLGPACGGRSLDALLSLPGDAVKLVALRGGSAEAIEMLRAVLRNRGRLSGHVVDVPFTRAASAACGAQFVYAALRPGGRIGLRMPTVLHLRRRCAFDRLAAGARPFVLVGASVEDSVSSDLLNAAFDAAFLDAAALRWSCEHPVLAVDAVREFGWAGLAVTIPYKEEVLGALRARGRLAESAAQVGSVNTVIRAGRLLVGHNTDLAGLLDALRPHLDAAAVRDRAMLVLGAGGAARAAVCAARELGMRPVVHARRIAAAAALGCDLAVTAADAAATRPAVVVDATPAGPPGGEPFLDPAALPGRAVVLDMLVHARPTALLAAAERAGHATVPGLDMLVAQAARQVELLGGDAPDRAAMRAVGAAWLARRDAPIVLVGLRWAGKTTTGERLAAVLGRPFLDTDREVEARAGRPIDEMLRAGDEAPFRRIEAEVLRWAADRPGTVVACGGGAALHGEAFAGLAAAGCVVLLDAPDGVLLARRASSPRAPLTPLPPEAELARQREERLPVYRAAARLLLEVSRLDAEAAADRIAAWWDALPPGQGSGGRTAAP